MYDFYRGKHENVSKHKQSTEFVGVNCRGAEVLTQSARSKCKACTGGEMGRSLETTDSSRGRGRVQSATNKREKGWYKRWWMSLYEVDGDEQVVYWQLISVAENRSQRVEAAPAFGGGTVRISTTPCPWKRVCLVTEREMAAHPYHREIWVGR